MRVLKIENYIQGELSLHIFQEDIINSHIDLHTHEFAEIIYVTSGECIQTIDGFAYHLKRGDMLFINRGSTHEFIPVNPFSYYNICFSPEIIIKRVIDRHNAIELLSLSSLESLQSTDALPLSRFSFRGEERQWLEALLQDMHMEYMSDQSERNAILESYMTILIAKILRKIHCSISETQKELSGVWRAISEFIDENLNQKISLEDLAQQCFYNPSYFSRTFKQKFGLSPIEYIARERSKMAASLLTTTTLSMDAIAEKCGYGDKSSLYRAFEKNYGCSPSDYRKEHNKK